MLVSLAGPIHGREALGWFVDMSGIGVSIGYFFTCAATIITMKRDDDNKALGVMGTIGAVCLIIFMILQLIPVPGLKGVRFGKESYMMLVIWIVVGWCFIWFRIKNVYYKQVCKVL